MLPAFIGILIFIVIPIVCSFALSFTNWDLLNEIEFVGFQNYREILSEKDFIQILVNTVVYALSTTFFAVIIPLVIASILNNKIKGAEFFKTVYCYSNSNSLGLDI